jgi:hypothetical protein
MNKLILVLIVIAALGCTKKSPAENAKTFTLGDQKSLVEQATFLNGFWLSDIYFENIEKSKSIYINREYKTELFGFTLEKENLLSDTAYLNGFTSHQGGAGSAISFDPKFGKFVSYSARADEYSPFSGPFELSPLKSKLEFNFPESNKKFAYPNPSHYL